MTEDPHKQQEEPSEASPLASVLRAMREDYEAGQLESLTKYVNRAPEHDEEVATTFFALRRTSSNSVSEVEKQVGHYRIVGELGRGGQAVVYRAEDTRLNRAVALKVMKGLGPETEDVLARFQREAEITSRLDHPGICPVYEIGLDDIPFIAMRLVEGESLAKRLSQAKSGDVDSTTESFVSWEEDETTHRDEGDEKSEPSSAPTQAGDLMASVHFIEKMARALHVAHEAGVIHRDIKPGNIMVTAEREPVLLDFGLAREEESEGPTLTQTGDLMGTPAYMSPEQLTGQRIRLDRRTDVYSLGVTLYEALTLQRPFDRPTREALYNAILTEEPSGVRRLNTSIPRDLAVVVETALQKNRDRRYQTALEFAEELRRVRHHEPILARPVGPLGRVLRWARRRPAAAALVAVLIMTLPTVAALMTAYLKDQPRVEEARLARLEEAKDRVLSEASFELAERRPDKALGLFKSVMEMEGGSPEAVAGITLAHLRLRNAEAALETLDKHGAVLGDGAAAVLLRVSALSVSGRVTEAKTLLASAPSPRTSFDYHVLAERSFPADDGSESDFQVPLFLVNQAILRSDGPRLMYFELRAYAAGRAKARSVALETASVLRERWPRAASAHLYAGIALGNVAEDDSSLRGDAIAAYREAIRLKPGYASAHVSLGVALYAMGKFDAAVATFREAIRLRPEDSTSHFNLGNGLQAKGQLDDAIAAWREAIRLKPDLLNAHVYLARTLKAKGQLADAAAALREVIRLNPDDTESHVSLGVVLHDRGQVDDAIAAYREAIRLKPGNASAHYKLGLAHDAKGQLDDAIAAYREVIRLAAGLAEAHFKLGNALSQRGQLNAAISAYRDAIQAKPEFFEAHTSLGVALKVKGQLDDAIAAHREAIRLKPGSALAHSNLGLAFSASGQVDDAIGSFHEAIRLQPDLSIAHYGLGLAFRAKGQLEDAILAYKAAIRLSPDDAEVHLSLGSALAVNGRADDAVASFREAIRLDPRGAGAHYNLGNALAAKGQLDDAIAAYREAIRLRPDWAEPHCNLGSLFARKNELEEAITHLRKGHQAGSAQTHWSYPSGEWLVDALYRWARSLLRYKDFEEARQALQEAAALTKRKDPLTLHRLAEAEFGAGERDKAIATMEEVLRLLDGKDTETYKVSDAEKQLARLREYQG